SFMSAKFILPYLRDIDDTSTDCEPDQQQK
ncbi:unnamed protein product, partial [Rotaria sp. Silwood2]